MSDIVDYMRAVDEERCNVEPWTVAKRCADAAAEIERLTGERDRQYDYNAEIIAKYAALEAVSERLRAALREIAKVTRGYEPGVWSEEEGRKYFAALFFGAQAKARAALKEEGDEK